MSVPGFENYTVYAPKTPPPSSLKMPIYLWGEGGCMDAGTPYMTYLTEIASHGYLVIANGPYGYGPPSLQGGSLTLPGPDNASPHRDHGVRQTPPDAMKMALEWVDQGNAAKYGNIDKQAVVTGGSSCGGIESYMASFNNPRVKLTTLSNFGLLNPLQWNMLKTIPGPVVIFDGGPLDIAYNQGQRDYNQMVQDNQAAVFANLDSGHLGTFFAKNGAKFGVAAVALFEAFFRKDAKSITMWMEPESAGSLKNQNWNITMHNFKL
ncbi:hypothetical protein K402DRAFT_394430 [Aulographum hederae CBS 113979]|uniref:Alpha/beta-hydrolase n=1 Tax=Aulographum hederae CBS 113979 TaxID=1176131 RepID=A0A6G1GYD3_9PEZI|nr:hypothetical protein K402DRAFT_394430 [Aulographum hederae CBS 113979]